jgi:hypothetical protein
MGYTTEFVGGFSISPKPDEYIIKYLDMFSDSRRLGYARLKPIYGTQGEFFVHGDYYGSKNGVEPIDVNEPPPTQPGLWCDWIIEKNKLKWDGREKFYDYDLWLSYLVNNFFGPSGYLLNGQISFQGEDFEDKGLITFIDNVIIKSFGSKRRFKITLANKDILLVKELLAGHHHVKIIEPNYKKDKLDFKALIEKTSNPWK